MGSVKDLKYVRYVYVADIYACWLKRSMERDKRRKKKKRFISLAGTDT
jgi:hypothetical protein